MTPETFAHIPLAHIVASLTNPRKTFNPERLAELAESIRASGMHWPVLLRPLPGSRVEDTAHLDPRPQYELVSGERRLRASVMAGADSIPAMVRALTEEQVLDIQLVENLQREDLEPLEEAEGYEHLMHRFADDERPPLTADEVAAKICKSRSYVYSRLKLLKLGPEGREALRLGQLPASHALLIARIPSTAIQAAALKNLHNSITGEVIGYRDAAALLQRQYMLRLSEATFKIADTALVPEAGSCRQCAKRTGADPDIFADVPGADVCTDPPCFQRKTQAHAAALHQAARESGATIIEGREAKALVPNSWDPRVEGYLRLDDKRDAPGGEKTLRQLIGKQMEKAGITATMVANPHKDGELIACLTHAQARDLLAAKGHQDKANALDAKAQESAKAAEEAELAKAQARYEAAWRWKLLANAWESITLDKGSFAIGAQVVRHIALQKAHALNTDRAARLCKLLQLGKVAPCAAVVDWVKEHREPDRALALLVMNEDVEHEPWKKADDPTNVGLLLIAEQVRETPEDAQREVQEAHKAEREARKTAKAAQPAEGDLPLNPAAQANGVRGGKGKKQSSAALAPKKPKTTAEEAMQGIAAAMQGQGSGGADAGPSESDPDGASAVGDEGRATAPGAGAALLVPGARVQFVGVHMTGQLGRLKGTAGLEGKWLVNVDGLSSDYVFEPHEFEVVAEEIECPKC
jgi:ParB/RepB/Spo0J family partition protein